MCFSSATSVLFRMMYDSYFGKSTFNYTSIWDITVLWNLTVKIVIKCFPQAFKRTKIFRGRCRASSLELVKPLFGAKMTYFLEDFGLKVGNYHVHVTTLKLPQTISLSGKLASGPEYCTLILKVANYVCFYSICLFKDFIFIFASDFISVTITRILFH